MKKRRIISLLFIFAILAFFTGVSCEKEKPLCERNHFGYLTVFNYTSIALWVDATESGMNYNQEVRLMPGASYKYSISPGTITVWAASDYNRSIDSWQTGEVYVTQCDESTFTWTGGKKGAEVSVTDGNGAAVYDESFKTVNKNKR